MQDGVAKQLSQVYDNCAKCEEKGYHVGVQGKSMQDYLRFTLLKFYVYLSSSNGNISMAEIAYLNDALDGFNTGDNRISGQAKVAVLSAGFKGLGGYNTLELSVRAKINGVIPYELLRFACDLKNEHYDIGNVRADGIAFSELAFGHSRDINDKLRLGAKLKLLLGIGNAQLGGNMHLQANLPAIEDARHVGSDDCIHTRGLCGIKGLICRLKILPVKGDIQRHICLHAIFTAYSHNFREVLPGEIIGRM